MQQNPKPTYREWQFRRSQLIMNQKHVENEGCWTRTGIYRNVHGMVQIKEWEWKTNVGIDKFTDFTVVVGNTEHSMYFQETGFSDRKLMLLSANFLTKINKENATRKI